MDLAVVLIGNRRNWNSLGALAGALEVDARFEALELAFAGPAGAPALTKALATGYGQVVAGFSFTTLDLVQIAGQVAELRRALPPEARPKVALVAGGPHATAAWRSTLALGFDYAVIGEGEAVFPELLMYLAGQQKAPCRVPGVAYRAADGAFVHNGWAPRVSLERYPPFSVRYRHQGPIEISRGCRHRCRFCATPYLAGRHVRHRPLAQVIRYVESCLRHGLDQVRFIAPNSFAYGSETDAPRLDLLGELLRATSELAGREKTYLGSFPSEVRPESVTPQAVELVARYCGNDNLVIGAQSGSQRMLDRMQRGHSVADILRAVEVVTAGGLRANVDIIFGLPGETAEDRLETLRLIDQLAGRGARIHSHTFLPLPGAPWARCPLGTIGEATARHLGALAGQGLQYGSWQAQAEKARQALDLLATLERARE